MVVLACFGRRVGAWCGGCVLARGVAGVALNGGTAPRVEWLRDGVAR